MAVRIKFDNLHNPIKPTVVLAKKSGEKLGVIPDHSMVFQDSLKNGSEFTFKVDKNECNKPGLSDWDSIIDFKLAWVKDWNRVYEIRVQTDEKEGITKTVSAVSLGEAELSQINLYNIEINTESDILRDDYVPSKLYDSSDPKASILSRIFEKAPHYKIAHVDDSIKDMKRSFSFNGKTIHDALNEVSEEIECVFIYECYFDEDGKLHRDVNVYDLKNHCMECGERGDFEEECSNCGSSNIVSGYGEDTTIFASSQNLADSITYSLDAKSVKNCFRLEAGDDLMTATIQNCNPNGSGSIWYLSDEVRKDMSPELASKLNSYDESYSYYQDEHNVEINEELLAEYNRIINKYKAFSQDYVNLASPITGYPALMQAYYDTIDFYMYIAYGLMPNVGMQDTTAQIEAGKLSSFNFIAVKNLNTASKTTVDSNVLAYAKYIIDPRYKVVIAESSYDEFVWSGKFTVTNYSDADDEYTNGNSISYQITSDYELYIKQMLEKALKKDDDKENPVGIAGLFELDETEFAIELKKYSLSRLKSFYDSCNGCLSIMTEQGVSNQSALSADNKPAYENVYIPYYNKLSLIEQEINVRENEIAVIAGKVSDDGTVEAEGVQTIINNSRSEIRDALDLEKYLGEDLWIELSSYRREDTYKNDNYISDGLNNAEIFANALQFIETAKQDIVKSATMQHSIKANLKNLLVIKEFSPISDHFDVGNWIRIFTDDEIHKLRILNYEINFDDIRNIPVDFSDVIKTTNGYSDLKSIINSAASMATSYNFVARQAKKGSESNGVISSWVNNGLQMTQTKIVNDADNQNFEMDRYGLSCRRYVPELDEYDPKQLKIINRGLYLTDDNWRTSRAGIGDFAFYNPTTRTYEQSYGVIADTLIGNLILSKNVGIFNESGSITMDENGFRLTADKTRDENTTPIFVIEKKIMDHGVERIYNMLSLNSDGVFSINANQVNIVSTNTPESTPIERTFNQFELDLQGYADSQINTSSDKIMLTVSQQYISNEALAEVENRVNSRIELTSNAFDIKISETESRIEDVDGNLQSQINNISANYRFTADGQYIGLDGSESIMHLYNDIMEIIVAGEAVTTVNRNGLTAQEASINTLHMGEYLWIYDDATEHLTLT